MLDHRFRESVAGEVKAFSYLAYGTLYPLVAIHSNRLLSFKFLNLVLREVFKL